MAPETKIQELEALISDISKDLSVGQLKSILSRWIPELDTVASGLGEPPYDKPKVQKSVSWSPRPESSDEFLSQAVSPLPTLHTLLQPTAGQTISDQWIYDLPYLLDHANLPELFELESRLSPTPFGVFLIRTGNVIKEAPRLPLTRGSVLQQTYSIEKHGILVMHEGERKELASRGETFDIPHVADANDNYKRTNLEELFETCLGQLASSTEVHEYLNATAHCPEIRSNLGLPGLGLQPGRRLLSAVEHFPGIQSSFVYISTLTMSVFSLHVEDFELKSANLLYFGAKLWIVVDPSSKSRLESRLAELLDIKNPGCSQFLRHCGLVPSPSLLRNWKIKFKTVLQEEGGLVLLQSNAYHWGINLGANMAEAINYSEDDWIVSPLYRECRQNRLPCPKTKPMRVMDMNMENFRPLDIDTSWEDPPKIAPKSKGAPKNTPTALPMRSSARLAHGHNMNSQKTDSFSLSKAGKASAKPRTPLAQTTRRQNKLDEELCASNFDRKFSRSDTASVSSDQSVASSESGFIDGPSDINQDSLPVTSRPPSPAIVQQRPQLQSQPGSGPVITENAQDSSTGSEKEGLISRKFQDASKADSSSYPQGFSQDSGTVIFAHPPTDNNLPASLYPPSSVSHVDTIQWWIDFVTTNVPRLDSKARVPFMSLFSIPGDACRTLTKFLPDQSPLSNSWLNDSIVVSTIQVLYQESRHAYVVDSLETETAHKQNESSLLLHREQLILLPCHYEAHWCLIVVDTQAPTFTVYNTSVEFSVRTQFVYDCFLAAYPNIQRKCAELYTIPVDTWNCGLFTILRAESLLDSTVLTVTDTSKLRARYIAKLLKPFHEHIEISHNLSMSQKRLREGDDSLLSQPLARLARPVFLDEVTESKQHNYRETLRTFNPRWLDFYDTQIESGLFPAATIYYILALASVIGGHQVLIDLSDICRKSLPQVPDTNTDQAASIYWLYQHAELTIACLQTEQRLRTIQFYKHFSLRHDYHHYRLKAKTRKERTGTRDQNKNAASYALDDLALECLHTSAEDKTKDPATYNTAREKIRGIKDKGKKLFQFNEQLSDTLGDMNGWILLPIRPIKCAFDKDISINAKEYLDLKDESLKVFIMALKQLRPKFSLLGRKAKQHLWIFCGIRGLKLKLENTDGATIAKEQLDSDLLLDCLEIDQGLR